MTQPPTMAAIMHPRWMLMYLGQRTVRSFAAEMEFAVMFVPTWAMYHDDAAKNAAARPLGPLSIHFAMISRGFQIVSP